MRKAITAIVATIIGIASPVLAKEMLLARATNYLGDKGERTFQLDIVEIENEAGSDHSGRSRGITREVRIQCISGCDRTISYRENIDDPLLGGAFVLRDDSPEFVTTWGGGSAYHVRIYRVEGDRIAKVLDAGTKSFPQFVMDRDGTFLTVLTDQDAPARTRKITVRGIQWRAGPHGYVPRNAGHE